MKLHLTLILFLLVFHQLNAIRDQELIEKYDII